DTRAWLTDVTSAYAALSVMGPSARALLERLTDVDLGQRAFPFGTVQEICVAHAVVRAMRISYVGESGWELYAPTEHAGAVYDALVAAGGDVGLRDAGYYALDSLRLEKGYRAWGRWVRAGGPRLEPGAGVAGAFAKRGGFLGRDWSRDQGHKGVRKRLVIFSLDAPRAFPWGDEPILRDGALVGWVTSAAFGHTI